MNSPQLWSLTPWLSYLRFHLTGGTIQELILMTLHSLLVINILMLDVLNVKLNCKVLTIKVRGRLTTHQLHHCTSPLHLTSEMLCHRKNDKIYSVYIYHYSWPKLPFLNCFHEVVDEKFWVYSDEIYAFVALLKSTGWIYLLYVLISDTTVYKLQFYLPEWIPRFSVADSKFTGVNFETSTNS